MLIPRHLKGVPMRLEDPNVLRGWLLIHKFSYQDLGELAGVSKQFIHQLATGVRRSCTAEVAAKIEAVLLPPADQRPPGVKPLFVPDGAAPVSRAKVRRAALYKEPLETRFWRSVDRRGDTECWPWTGSKLNSGYGQLRTERGRDVAHRVAYELIVGPIPEGLELDHVADRGCVRRDCVNPAHLEPVPHSENTRRGKSGRPAPKVTGHCVAGHDLEVVGVYPFRHSWRCAECERIRAKENYRAKKARLALQRDSKVAVDESPILSEASARVTT